MHVLWVFIDGFVGDSQQIVQNVVEPRWMIVLICCIRTKVKYFQSVKIQTSVIDRPDNAPPVSIPYDSSEQE